MSTSASSCADATTSSSPLKRPRATSSQSGDYQFFVTLIPDDDPESSQFSGIHAKSLLVSKVLADMLSDCPRTSEVCIPMIGEKSSTLSLLLRWLFRSTLPAPFTFDTDVWRYAKLADKYEIPLLRMEVEGYYLRSWPPGCPDTASQFVVFNESCRYHLDGIKEIYGRQVESNIVAFFTAGYFGKLMDIDLSMAHQLAKTQNRA